MQMKYKITNMEREEAGLPRAFSSTNIDGINGSLHLTPSRTTSAKTLFK